MPNTAQIHPPWYRQFWPWVLIAIPLAAVIMGGITLWLAISNPDYLVVKEDEYDRIRSELRVQDGPAEEPSAAPRGDDEQP